jgi:hypothetical protein
MKNYDILMEAWAYCDKLDKSTEFMLQYMADKAKINTESVSDFLYKVTEEERKLWYKINPNWYKKYKEIKN